MVKLVQVKHLQWKDLNIIVMTHKEGLFQDQQKRYLSLYKAQAMKKFKNIFIIIDYFYGENKLSLNL